MSQPGRSARPESELGALLITAGILVLLPVFIPIMAVSFLGIGLSSLGFALLLIGLAAFPTRMRLAGPKVAVALSILAAGLTVLVGSATLSFNVSESPCPNPPCDYSWLMPYENATLFGMIGSVVGLVLLLVPLPRERLLPQAKRGLRCPDCGRIYPADAGRLCAADNAQLVHVDMVTTGESPPLRRAVDLTHELPAWIAWAVLVLITVVAVSSWVNADIVWWSSTNLTAAVVVVTSLAAGTWTVCFVLGLRRGDRVPA